MTDVGAFLVLLPVTVTTGVFNTGVLCNDDSFKETVLGESGDFRPTIHEGKYTYHLSAITHIPSEEVNSCRILKNSLSRAVVR